MTTDRYEKTLYENYNALFFSASPQNSPLHYYTLFTKHMDTLPWKAFHELIKNYDVNNSEHYQLWIMVWKQNYKHLVHAIRLCKQYRVQKELEDIGVVSAAYDISKWQSQRERLRSYARQMLELRMAAKAARKEQRMSEAA